MIAKPKRPAGRTLAECKDQNTKSGLLPAEDALRAAAQQGESCDLDEHDDDRVRASFIRFLALGGDAKAPVHEKGVDLKNATIEGQLDLKRCKYVLPLNLDECTFSYQAPIMAQDAHLSLLSLQGSTVPGGIQADRATVDGNVFLRNGASITGELQFSGAHIHGDLDASNSTLQNKGSFALNCDRAWIGGNLDLKRAKDITGEVRLTGVQIKGYLIVLGTILNNPNGMALICDGARIGGNVDLREQAKIAGTLRFPGARIEGDLYADKSTLTDKNGITLIADHAVIEGKALLSNGFKCDGTIHLAGATVRRDLDLRGSTIQRPGGWAIDLQDIRVDGTLHLDSVRDDSKVCGRIDGGIDLHGANVAYFADRLADTEPENASGAIHLDQFRFERFVGNSTLDVDARLRWLRFQPSHHQRRTANPPAGTAEPSGFRPQPYDQLAEVYRAIGHHWDYHRVLREKHTRALRDNVGISPDLPTVARLWKWLLSITSWQRLAPLKWLFLEKLIGYGHRVLPMFAIFFVLLGASVSAFWWASDAGHMVPADSRILALNEVAKKTEVFTASCDAPWTHCNSLILDEYPDFNAFVYSADVLLPIVGFEQQTAWTPNLPWLDALKWINILYGWFTGLMLVAIVSGVVQRA